MSGFDVMMRSQEQTSRTNAFYDAQRYDSMRATGAAAADAMKFSVELGMQQTEQAMRIASFEQEWQANQIKLQGMMALDQTALSRETVRGAKLQNDAMQFEMDQKKEAMAFSKQRDSEQVKHWVRGELGGLGLAELGYDPVTLDKITDQGEQQKTIDAMKRAEAGTRRGQYADPRLLARDRTSREIDRLRDAINKERDQIRPDLKRIETIQKQIDKLDSEYNSYFDQDEPEQQEEPGAAAPKQRRMPYNNDRRDQIATQIAGTFTDKEDPVFGPLAKIPDQDSRLRVGYALASLADRLVEYRNISPEMAPKYVMGAAKEDPVLVAYALQVGGWSDEKIRAYLRATNAYDSDAKLDNAMRRLKDQSDFLLRPFIK